MSEVVIDAAAMRAHIGKAFAGARYALPVLISGALWLLALYPGMMNSDVTDQWNQALTGQLNDWHPIFHTFVLRMLIRVWASPALVSILQVVTFAALVGWAVASARRAGLSNRAAWIAATVPALLPVVGIHLVYLVKDVPFAIAAFALGVLVFRAVEVEGAASRPTFWIGLGVAGTLALLFRHNGLPVALGAFVAVLLADRRRWRAVAVTLTLVLVLGFGVRALLLRTHGAKALPSALALVGYLGAHIQAGTELLPDERRFLDEVHPLEDRWNYVCFSNVPTVFDGKFDLGALERNAPRLQRLALALTLRAPGTTLRHVACASRMLWQVDRTATPLATSPIRRDDDGRFSAIDAFPAIPAEHRAALLPALGQRVMGWIHLSERPKASWFFWRPGLPLWGLVLAALVCGMRRRTPRAALVLLPALFHTAALALVIPSPEVRYQLPIWLLAAALVPVWFALKAPSATRSGA